MGALRRFIGVVLLLLATVAALAGASAPWSPSGWMELGGVAAFGLALIVSRRRLRRSLAFASGALLLVLLGMRLTGVAHARIHMFTLPGGSPARESGRWLAGVIDEQDVSLVGARILPLLWHLPRSEGAELVRAMEEGYREERSDLGSGPSPFLDTLLGRQSPEGFDALVVEPEAAPPHSERRSVGVVFLHGFGGSFALECWLMAKSAREIGAVTVCPAVGFSGRWDNEAGLETVRTTLGYLHARGIDRVYLAGLSNGAVGVGALAPRFATSLAGLVFVSGVPSSFEGLEVPMLVVQGERDSTMPAAPARAFAQRVHATYVGFASGHFALLERRAEARSAIGAWLRSECSSLDL